MLYSVPMLLKLGLYKPLWTGYHSYIFCLQPPKKHSHFGVFHFATAADGMGRQWEVTRKSLVQIPRLGGEMSEIHLLIEDQWLEQESLPSLWSDVIVEVKCLSESDTDIVGFSRFHAGSPSLCCDILFWFSVNLLSRPLPYYTAKYRGNYVFTSMSNKVTVKLISARL